MRSWKRCKARHDARVPPVIDILPTIFDISPSSICAIIDCLPLSVDLRYSTTRALRCFALPQQTFEIVYDDRRPLRGCRAVSICACLTDLMELVSFRLVRGPGIEMDREDPPARRRVPPVLPIPVPFFAVVRHRAVSEQPNIALPFVPPDVGEGMGNLVIDIRMRNMRFFDIRRQQMSGRRLHRWSGLHRCSGLHSILRYSITLQTRKT